MTPIGMSAKHLVVALEGRGFGVFRPVGLEGDLRDLAIVGPGGRDALGPFRRSAMHEHHVRVLGMDLIELGPDRPMIGGVAAREGDLRSGRQQHLVVGPAFGGDEVTAVDHG